MRYLVVDAGNSRIAVAVAGAGDVPWQVDRIDTPTGDADVVDLALHLEDAGRAEGCDALILASVVPHLDAALLARWKDARVIDHRLELPFGLDIEHAETVGADRFCNIGAAVGAGMRDALVVDIGTATTFDLLRDGRFAGGLIAPGMAAAARCLSDRGERLPDFDFRPMPMVVGRNTVEAMQAGAWHCGVNGVVGTVESLLESCGERPVILTGGLASLIDRPAWTVDPEWTLRGALFLGGD